ncbi:MAG: PTS glucitol/sorbitol transporter subunit IIA [Filifactoraceae bacterium]
MEYIITNAGISALEMFKEHNMIVLFDDSAPEELAEISVTHKGPPINKSICIGDILQIAGEDYIVTAVGEDANRTLKTIGHATLKFSGKDKVALPGQIELKGKVPPRFIIGETIKIIYNH